MKNTNLVLFIISLISLFIFEDSLRNNFSLINFIQPFVFVSLPFLLAYFLGWKKGFGLSIIFSLVTLAIVWLTSEGGDPWLRMYAMFFAFFSVLYFGVAWIVSKIYKNKTSNLSV